MMTFALNDELKKKGGGESHKNKKIKPTQNLLKNCKNIYSFEDLKNSKYFFFYPSVWNSYFIQKNNHLETNE